MHQSEAQVAMVMVAFRFSRWAMFLCCGLMSLSAAADQPSTIEKSSTVNKSTTLEESSAAGSGVSAATIYRSPEERREAGVGTQFTDWLKVSGLLEAERDEREFEFQVDMPEQHEDTTAYAAQIAFEISLGDHASAEIIVESEKDVGTTTVLDEALLVLEFDPFELEIGKFSLPFGEYYSHFITGPMLEFSETKSNGLVVNYQVNDAFELSGFVFDGKFDRIDSNNSVDWGTRLEFVNERESFKVGVGYLSDLAESDEEFIEAELNLYQRKVAALNLHALLGFQHFEITAEYTAALDSFSEFEAVFDKPQAANLELSWFINNKSQLSLRRERSNEFADNPKTRTGLNLSWLALERLQFSLEYLRSDYRKLLVEDDEEQQLRSDEIVAMRITYEF